MWWNIIILLALPTFLLASFFYFFPKFWINELALSFSPYIILFISIIFAITVVFFRRTIKKKGGISSKDLFFAILILLLGTLIFFYGNRIKQFYLPTQQKLTPSTNTGITLMFSNIFYKNTNTEDIIKHINKNTPDIIAFVEFSLHHKTKLYPTLVEHYPYTNITQRSKTHAGNIVFSKYPLEDLNHQTQQGSWRYNYIAIHHNGKKYYLYVVHTTAPISPEYFDNRNTQLIKFTQDILSQNDESSHNARTIIVGDFNITPWSAYYKKTLNTLPFNNITRYYPWLFTRYFSPIPIFQAHIDHVFLSKNLRYATLDTFQLQWSDHKGLLIKNIQ